MKAEKKNILKDNHGVALTMVMMLIFVMTFMGGAMYAYTMQSLKTLEYGTSRQKAEYIARSGIEASVFMYQDAMLKDDDEHKEIREFLQKTSTREVPDPTNPDKKVLKEGEDIKTNWIYLLTDGKTYKDGGDGDEPLPISEEYIGYYRVTISNDKKTYQMPVTHTPDGKPMTPGADGKYPTEEKTEYIKRFTSVGYCKGRQSVKKAYIVPLVDITTKGWITKDGEISLEKSVSDTTSIVEKTYISINCGWIDKIISDLGAIFDPNHKYVDGRVQNLPMYVGSTSGNMVISAPKDENGNRLHPIHFVQEGKDHAAGFVSMANLFVDGDISVEPLKKHFDTLFLRGNQIVINGDINMYVYDPQTNKSNGFTSWISGLAAKIARNYRFSTVVLGTPSSVTTTVTDPKPAVLGGLGQCGQVYFGGDVYVNFITRGGATRKYKVFSAGETYYFDGNFQIETTKNGTKAPYGVDLLKYFLDTELQKKRYASTVLQQFERTRDFYYSKTISEYSAGLKANEKPSMRKIEVKTENPYDKITDTVVPSPGDGTYVIWE